MSDLSDFRELKAPRNTGTGWYLATKSKTEHVAWLTIHGDITQDTSNTKILYHKTELEAHAAARDYYNSRGWMYTYTAELQALQKVGVATQNDVNESQVMTFGDNV